MTVDLSRLVKPLVWAPDSGKHTHPQRVKAIIPGNGGDYTVFGSDRKNEWMWCRNGYFVDGHQMQKAVALELAQAAANADHAARVLASLDTALIEELVGALDNLIDAVTAEDRFGDRSLTITGSTAALKWLIEAQDEASAILAKLKGGA